MNRQLDYDYARKNKQKINKRNFILLSYMFFNLKKKRWRKLLEKIQLSTIRTYFELTSPVPLQGPVHPNQLS